MLQKFLNDLTIPNCKIQFGTENRIIKSMSTANADEIGQIVEKYDKNNLYFLGGVKDAVAIII